MKTLIINGSPKKDGDTAALLHAFTSHLSGEIKTISCFSDISPCIDCRHCWTNDGCALQDEMQDIYPFIEECDNIVIASPIWYSSLSGPTLNLTSRIQMFYAAAYLRQTPRKTQPKNGVILLTGGKKGTETAPTQTAKIIMNFLNVHRPGIITVYSLNTNHVPAAEDLIALQAAQNAAISLNRRYQSHETP